MDPVLSEESARLVRSWMRHDPALLRDYLVQDVEDPRLNIQSILTRHFLLQEACGARYAALQERELAFAVLANWLLTRLHRQAGPEELAAIWHALERGADDAEGMEIPPDIQRAAALAGPDAAGLFGAGAVYGAVPRLPEAGLDALLGRWKEALAGEAPSGRSVLELACGSANDYRAMAGAGLARLFDYTGVDLCETNVANARALFPEARFEAGNVFGLEFGDGSFDHVTAHDLFEHLSPAGLEAALDELCRVARRSFCVGFFSMAEQPAHTIRPFEEYHWNTLSLERVRERMEGRGFEVQALHVATWLARRLGSPRAHNPNAYTLAGRRAR